LIKLLVAGNRDFCEIIQRQAPKESEQIRLVNISTEPSMAVDAIENRINADAILLGFTDREIKIIADVAIRNQVSSVFFVSADDPAAAYFKWSKYKMKIVPSGRELFFIIKYFSDRPELIKDSAPAKRNIFDNDDINDSQARVEKARVEEDKNQVTVIDKKIIVVFGPKGGIGKTCTSVSLARSVSKLTNMRVALVDLEMNRDYGDVLRYLGYLSDRKEKMVELKTPEWAVGMGLPQEKTVSGWSNFPWELRTDRKVVEASLVKIDQNFFILPPMRSLMDQKAIDYEVVRKTIDVLRRHFSLVVVDGSNTLTSATLAAIESCDELFITASAKIPILDSLADFIISTINHIKGDPVISLIINDMPDEFPYNLAEELPKLAGGFPVAAMFPKDSELDKMVSVHAQVPYLGAHDTPYTREMENLLLRLYPRGVIKAQDNGKKNIFGFLKKMGSIRGR